jgi:FAD/FMN-containing dehydrogenase
MTIEDLKQNFSGSIILPDDPGYEQAATVLVRKGSPALIAEVNNAHDTTLAINYARANNLIISVRSGGHSNAGLSTNDGGIIIDVSKLHTIEVHDKNRVKIGAGATWGQVAQELQSHGLAISAGDTKSVGVSGLALGGGIGWMVRKYGLALDSLQQVWMVTADGKEVTASATENADLFWALRGGGGNFGVVTAMEFVAHPAGDVYFGALTFAAHNPAAQLTAWRDAMRAAPPELTSTAMLLPPNAMGGQNPALFVVTACFDGDNERAATSALVPLRAIGPAMGDKIVKKPYAEVLEEVHPPKGVRIEVNNALFNDFSDDVIARAVQAYGQGLLLQLRHVAGALNKVPADATAFAHRNSEVLIVCPRFLPADANESQIQDALKPWRELAKDADGAYINFFSRAGKQEVSLSYPPSTFSRLAAVKKQYDQQNVFSQNLNVQPD